MKKTNTTPKITRLGTRSGQNTGKAERLRNLTPDEINSMNLEEIRKTANDVRKVVNDNTRRIIKAGFANEPHINTTMLSTKGLKNVNDYRKFLREALVRLRAKTGTVTGIREYQKRMDEIISGYSSLSNYKKDELWTLVDAVRDLQPNLVEAIGSQEAVQNIFSIFEDKLLDANEAIDILKNRYEELQLIEAKRWEEIEGYTDNDEEIELPF